MWLIITKIRLTCLHDNLVTVLGWINEDMPKWLAPIDPLDDVCAEIREEMGGV